MEIIGLPVWRKLKAYTTTVELKPEMEALVQKRLQSGAFARAEEVSNVRLSF